MKLLTLCGAALALAGCSAPAGYPTAYQTPFHFPAPEPQAPYCDMIEGRAVCPSSTQEEVDMQAQELQEEQAKQAAEQKIAAAKVMAQEKEMDEQNARFDQKISAWRQLAQRYCPDFPTGTILSAYNRKLNSFQGRPIKWASVRGVMVDPQQPAMWEIGTDKLNSFLCSAYAVAYTADGSNLEVTVPIVFQISPDGKTLVAFTFGAHGPGY